METAALANAATSPCQACGACCAFSRDWPRFTLETDADLYAIPQRVVADDLSGMRWTGSRCAALEGDVGVATACMIYGVRPHVCRACQPGDDACRIARRRHGLSEIASVLPEKWEPVFR